MQYNVLLLNFDNPVPVGSSGHANSAPWGDKTPYTSSSRPALAADFRPDRAFTINPTGTSSIVIEDDDTYLQWGFYSPDEVGQSLVSSNVTLGDGAHLPEGTRLAGYIGSRLLDEDGNIFRVQFPRTFVQSQDGEELGGKHSVLVFPEPRTDETGTEYLPTFDPNKNFNLLQVAAISRSNLAYYPQLKDEVQCFTRGTMILTPYAPRPIETLRPGDLVVTRDHGARPLRWIGASNLDAGQLDLQPNLRPILIRAGALGNGMPEHDLAVSPQHRVLVSSKIARRMFDKDEILVAAKHLTSLPGINAINPEDGVSYWHMLFDAHELVLSNGSWTESLYTGPQALKGMSSAAKREIFALFPELQHRDYRANAARRVLSGREGRKLVERHIKNGKPLIGQI